MGQPTGPPVDDPYVLSWDPIRTYGMSHGIGCILWDYPWDNPWVPCHPISDTSCVACHPVGRLMGRSVRRIMCSMSSYRGLMGLPIGRPKGYPMRWVTYGGITHGVPREMCCILKRWPMGCVASDQTTYRTTHGTPTMYLTTHGTTHG